MIICFLYLNYLSISQTLSYHQPNMVHLWFSSSEQKTPISAQDKPKVEQDKSDHVTPGVPVTPQEAEEGKKVFDAKVTLKSVNIELRVKGTFGSFSLLFSTVTFCIPSLKRKLQHLLSFDAPVSESLCYISVVAKGTKLNYSTRLCLRTIFFQFVQVVASARGIIMGHAMSSCLMILQLSLLSMTLQHLIVEVSLRY